MSKEMVGIADIAPVVDVDRLLVLNGLDGSLSCCALLLPLLFIEFAEPKLVRLCP